MRKLKLLLLLIAAISTDAFSEDLSKTCSFNNCRVGDKVTTSYSQGSPAVGCSTKNLSIYANFVVGIAMTEGLAEYEVKGEDAKFLKQLRKSAGVTNLKGAMKKCWRLLDAQQAQVVEYADGGSVMISPTEGGLPYWTQSNHLDRQ